MFKRNGRHLQFWTLRILNRPDRWLAIIGAPNAINCAQRQTAIHLPLTNCDQLARAKCSQNVHKAFTTHKLFFDRRGHNDRTIHMCPYMCPYIWPYMWPYMWPYIWPGQVTHCDLHRLTSSKFQGRLNSALHLWGALSVFGFQTLEIRRAESRLSIEPIRELGTHNQNTIVLAFCLPDGIVNSLNVVDAVATQTIAKFSNRESLCEAHSLSSYLYEWCLYCGVH